VFDNEEFSKLLNERYSELRNEESNLVQAAEFFGERVVSAEPERLDELRKRLTNSMTVVSIKCGDESSAFRLFETLNNRGLDLSSVDLMKNHLFKIANEKEGIDYGYIKEKWREIVGEVRGEVSRPPQFFRHYMMFSPMIEINESITRHTLYGEFREVVNENSRVR
jgi:uncharacterized protein with ParB-like and HNH nuclease domain